MIDKDQAAQCPGDFRAQQAAEWFKIGNSFLAENRWEEASLALRQSVACNANQADAWASLGKAEEALDRPKLALQAYDRSLALAPDQPLIAAALVSMVARLGQPEHAIALLQNALLRNPKVASLWTALGNALLQVQRWEEATEAHWTAQSLGPPDYEIFYNLAKLRVFQYALPEAESLLRAIVSDEPKTAPAWALLGETLRAQGRVGESINAMQRSIDLEPSPERHSKLLLASQYLDDVTPGHLLEEHRRWNEAYAKPLGTRTSIRNSIRRASEGLLRIGFCSSNLKRHPIGFLSLRAIERLNRNDCHVVCYSDYDGEDDFTVRFRNASSIWRVTNQLSAPELAQQIEHDQIDILVDLEGHTADRLLVFARKPAPMQVTWLGYVGTTGVAAMDYLLADWFHVPRGEEVNYSETVLRMPNGYACYEPPGNAPQVGPLPASTLGRITFGCFNNPAKFSPRTLETWAAILRRVPTAQLMLKYPGLASTKVQDAIRVEFAQHEIGPQRVLFERDSDHSDLMAAYGRVDLALDPLAYSGGLTTCEALWMGVPVITRPGSCFASRHSTSHLTNAGYGQFVASGLASYVELAVEWAGRIDELAAIRAQMRQQVAKSALCDGEGFARAMLAMLREAWERKVRSAECGVRNAE